MGVFTGRKVVIEFHRLTREAGAYDLVVYDNGISEAIRLYLNSGSPYLVAYREAELLAIALDCWFKSDDGTIREPLKEV